MDYLQSFLQNLKDKITNPFFGTLTLVLIFHHWELWYSIFNFSSNLSRVDKIGLINKYIDSNLTTEHFINDILLAFAFMLIGYGVIIFTRSIVLYIEYRLMPNITKNVISKNVVTRKDFDIVVKERDDYFKRYEDQKQKTMELNDTIDEQRNSLKDSYQINEKDKNEIKSLKSDLSSKDTMINNNKIEINNLKTHNDKLQNEISNNKNKICVLNIQVKQYDRIFHEEVKDNIDYFNSVNSFPPLIRSKYEEIKDLGLWNNFVTYCTFSNKDNQLGKEIENKLKDIDLIQNKTKYNRLLPYGKIIWQYKNVFDPKSFPEA